jgi:uncharacterized membrane protein
MTFTRNKTFLTIFVLFLFMNITVMLKLNSYPICTILNFLFLSFIPGLLILLMLKIRETDFWEYLVYSFGLSIASLMFFGLFVNWLLPVTGITDKPLSPNSFLVCFDIFIIIIGIVAILRNKDMHPVLKFPDANLANSIFFIVPLIFPVLSIMGSTSLNNNGTNIFTMLMIGGVAIYVFALVLCRNKLNNNIYPWVLFLFSISMLLATSLRSWNISGHDIIQEFQMFQLTKENFFWTMQNFPGHAYNACLSITILPTIFSGFLGINDEYIFRICFQIFFSILPIIIYLFLKRYAKPVLAFLSVFFFISFPTFFIDLPMMIRQEISLVFFSLALLVIFNKEIKRIWKEIFFVVFGISMIVAHYSTSYITYAILLSTYILTCVVRISEKIKLKRLKNIKIPIRKHYLRGYLLLALIVFGFLWFVPLTHIAGDLVSFLTKSLGNMKNEFILDLKGERTSLLEQFNIFYKPKDKSVILQEYLNEVELKYKDKSNISHYPIEKYKDFQPVLVGNENMPVKLDPGVVSKIYLFAEIIQKLIKVFLIVGVFYLLFFYIKKREMDIEYILMTFLSLFWLVAVMVMPFSSIEYHLGRAYLQVSIVLALPAILGFMIIFKFIKKKNIKSILISLIFIIYFLFSSEFINQIIGGRDTSIHLDNSGTYYDKYYNHTSEIASGKWLTNNYDKERLVYVDGTTTSLKLTILSNLKDGQFVYNILPSIMSTDAYVFSNYTNTTKKMIIQSFKSDTISHNFPDQFLDDNKNKIYSNGGSEIFK